MGKKNIGIGKEDEPQSWLVGETELIQVFKPISTVCSQYYLCLAIVIKICLLCLMAIKMALWLADSEKYFKDCTGCFLE